MIQKMKTLLFVVLLMFVVISCENKIKVSNVNGNMDLEQWICFGNPEDGSRIYKITTNGKGLEKVSDAKMEGISKLEEWIYYKDNKNIYDKGTIRRLSKDGKKDEEVISVDIDKYIVTEDVIYCEDDEEIYKYNINSSDLMSIFKTSENIFEIKLFNNKIYFSTNKSIYEINTDGSKLKKLVNNTNYKFNITDNYLLYNDTKGIKKLNLNTMVSQSLIEENIYNSFVDKDNIYYTKDKYLHKKNIITGEDKSIYLTTYAFNFYNIDDYLYCYGDNFLWKVKKDFSEKKVIFGSGLETDNSSIAIYKNKTLVKSIDYSNYMNNNEFVYEVKDGVGNSKLINSPISKMYIQENILYYINSEDKNLYSYNFDTNKINKIYENPISDFVFCEDELYFSRLDKNYNLYCIRDGKEIKISDKSIYNLKVYNGEIYFVDRGEGNKLYLYKNGNEKLLIDNFVSQYEVIDHIIYYVNDTDNGKIYFWDGENEKKLTDNTVEILYKHEENLYYIINNKVNLLYYYDVKNGIKSFVKFMQDEMIDFCIDNNNIYETVISEDGGVGIKKTEYNKSLSMFVDERTISNRVSKNKWVYCYNSYLFEYNIDNKELKLLYEYPINKMIVKDNWLYITGDIGYNEYKSYIRRINLEDNQIDTLIESEQLYTPAYEYEIEDGLLFYNLPINKEKNQLKVMDLKNRSSKILTNNCSNLLCVVDNIVYYKDFEQCIYKIKNDGSNEIKLTDSKSNLIKIFDNSMYYFRYNDVLKGRICVLDIETKNTKTLVENEINEWDYVIYENNLFYIENSTLVKMPFENDIDKSVIQENVTHFYIDNDEIVIYMGSESEIVRKKL